MYIKINCCLLYTSPFNEKTTIFCGFSHDTISAHAGQHTLTVFQDPNCGCCGAWSQYMEDEGYTVNTVITNNIIAGKQKLRIPPQLSSCHTAVIDDTGQIIKGHVPVSAI